MCQGTKWRNSDAPHLRDLFSGEFAPTFWFAQIGGIILPIVAFLFKKMREASPDADCFIHRFLSLRGLNGSLIVVTPLAVPYLPKQHYPDQWLSYKPTLIETLITTASFILALMIISILVKLFPVIPIWEVAEEQKREKNEIKQ